MKKGQMNSEREGKAQTVFTRDNTNRIMERAKIKKFSDIFRVLDSDGDGTISAQRIDITSIDPNLLQVLSPLFCEMEELGQTLDEDEFIEAIGRLYDSLSLPERNTILQLRQKWNNQKSKMSEE